MKPLAIAGVVVATAVVAGVLVYRFLLPRAFVAAGRGVVADTTTVSITRVSTAPATVGFGGEHVAAGPGQKYVQIDCRISAPAGKLAFDDFQLVRDRVPQLGAEENIGDHGDRDYFYWSFLDASGAPISELPDTTSPVDARLAFKVPSDARAGYLFYWGLYWGPLEFAP